MSAETDIAFLQEYDEWKSQKRIQSNNLSPEEFLIDRSKEQALATLVKIAEYYERVGVGDDQLDAEDFVGEVGALLNDL